MKDRKTEHPAHEHHEPHVETRAEEFTELPEAEAGQPPKGRKPTPEEIEAHWLKHTYRGDMPQLTLRAVGMGALLGGFMSLSNIYVGLKTGWGLGVAITACILSYAIYRTLSAAFPRLFAGEFTILENTCMQTTASSAGYSTGGTLSSAIAAYLIVTGHHIPWLTLTLWTLFLAGLGCFMSIPMKRQMINIEQLRFPSGIAAAEVLKSLHTKGSEAADKAKSLGIAGLLGAVIVWFKDSGNPFILSRFKNAGSMLTIPSYLHFPGSIGGQPLHKYTISLELSTIMVAAGALIGWKVGWSMLLGACVNYGVLAPWMAAIGAIDSKLGYREIVRWSTWTGASIMATSGLFMFALQWRTVVRAFSGITDIFKPHGSKTADKMAHIEVPTSWFLTGLVISGLGCMAVLKFAFDTTVFMGFVAVAMTFFLAIVACRATGETDTTPVGAMGKITQLMFGVLAPSNITTNLMTASVTANAAGSSADLLTSLKTGYILGANPRKQFLAQLLGIFAGMVVVIPAFYVLVPNAEVLGTDKWPAPSAQVWAAVARLLANGFSALHPTARWGLLIGALIGILIPVLERLFPKHHKFIPSAMGVGMAFVIPFFNSLSMFIGAAIATLLEAKKPQTAEKYVVTVASGFIAGESLLGVAIALLTAAGILGG
ncbi:MAG TPA: peptide transporter [Elusimicrobia bacterium]|nr:peptide transporter [Elusimicrobiota bacterium]HBT61396.1 peptide transporter [Elusimicrobiota bacterium]